MILGSNVVVLHSAQYSVGFRAGRDRVSEIWTCKKTQARQHCFDSKRIVTKRSRAISTDLFLHPKIFPELQIISRIISRTPRPILAH